jgi:hypothetical protein
MRRRSFQLTSVILVLFISTFQLSGKVLAVDSKHEVWSVSKSQDKSPDWSFSFAYDALGKRLPNGILSPKAFGYAFCKGSFQPLVKRAAYLDWGAQSSCTASNNYFHLHQVRVELYDSCLGPLCLRFEKIKQIYSPASSNYSRVATANGHDFCRGRTAANSRTYEQRVFVIVRYEYFGPFAQQSGIANCDIQP